MTDALHFARPGFLWLLWLLVPLVALLWWSGRRRREALLRFADEDLLPRLLPAARAGSGLRIALLAGAFGLLILSAAGPRWGFQWEQVNRRGVDLVVALDLSRSMLAEDSKPDRLTAAKREIRDLLDLLQGDRIALVAFAGTAYIQCPLTLDAYALEVFLDQMHPNRMDVGGTDLAAAVRASVAAFPEDERAGRAVLLITDGEDHSGELAKAAEEARQAGAHVFVVGMGAPEGAPIPDGRGGFVKEGGKVVLSKLDEAALEELALTTEGTYVRSQPGDLDLRTLYLDDIKGRLEARDLTSSRQRRWEERFQWALLPAILLLLLEGVSGAPRRRVGPAALALALLLPVAAPTPALAWSLFEKSDAARGQDAWEAGDWDEALERWQAARSAAPADRRLDYNVAEALYRLERYPEAEQEYLAASATDQTELAADALYGAGNAAFQQGRYPDAIAHYNASLALRPDDADALHNRELARKRFEELQEQAQQPNEQPQDEEQEQEQDGETEQDEQQQGEEGEDGQEQQEKQQQSGQTGQEEEDAQDGQAQDSEPQDDAQDQESEGQDGQAQPEPPQDSQQEATGGAAEAADIERSPDGAEEDGPADGDLSSVDGQSGETPEETVTVEGALSKEQAERLLKALEADQARRREERTENEARRGRRSAGKDW